MAGRKGFQSAEVSTCIYVENCGSLLLLSREIHPSLLYSGSYPMTKASDESLPSGRLMVYISIPL